MAQVPPKKNPKKLIPKTHQHRMRSVEEETAGKLYLVRDKDYGKEPPVLWGFDLPWTEASQLKEKVAARNLSRTVRVEEQLPGSPYVGLEIDPRSPYTPTAPRQAPRPVEVADPEITRAQHAARTAARPVALAAQARARVAPAVFIPPPPMPEISLDGEQDEGGLPAIDTDELDRLLNAGDMPTAEELEAAAAEVEEGAAPINWVEQAMHWPCKHEGCGAMPAIPCTDPSGPITHPERIQAARLAGPLGEPVDLTEVATQ